MLVSPLLLCSQADRVLPQVQKMPCLFVCLLSIVASKVNSLNVFFNSQLPRKAEVLFRDM